MSWAERVRESLPRRALWRALAVSLALTALAAVAVWQFELGGNGSIVPWLVLGVSWVIGYGLVFVCGGDDHDYRHAEMALGVVNPVTVWFGGWMFAVVLWLALAVLLRAVWEDVFGWGSVDEEPPVLEV